MARGDVDPGRPQRLGYVSQLREATQTQLRDVIESVDPADATHPERRKLADLYAAFMDETGVEKAGLAGLHDVLQRIHGLHDKADLPMLFAELSRLWVRIPWDIDVYPDEHDATVYAAHLGQGRLGLPDRDYYLKDEPHFQSIRSAYRDHIVKLLSLAREPAAATGADGIIALETALARLQWTRVQNRDPIKTYNKTVIAELPALIAPQDLPSFISAAGVGSGIATVVVKQPSYFAGIGAILRDTPVETWQAYLVYNVLSSYAAYLTAPFVAEDFAFEQHALRDVPEMQPRWKRAVASVDRLIGFDLGSSMSIIIFPRPTRHARKPWSPIFWRPIARASRRWTGWGLIRAARRSPSWRRSRPGSRIRKIGVTTAGSISAMTI